VKTILSFAPGKAADLVRVDEQITSATCWGGGEVAPHARVTSKLAGLDPISFD